MKITHIAILLTATTLGLTGCQSTKNVLNGFTGGTIKNVSLPSHSTTRIQFVMKDGYGLFVASPNSKELKVNGKNQGVIANTVGFFGSNTESSREVTLNDLGMLKPSMQLDPKRRTNNIVERYVNANEQIALKYRYNRPNGRGTSYCDISGRLTTKPNTDYRVTGWADTKKCYISLEEFVKNPDGTMTLQPIPFESR